MNKGLHKKYNLYTKKIAELYDLYRLGQIDLDPPFQKKAAWNRKQKKLFISSILNGMYMCGSPMIFQKHFNSDEISYFYRVIDGRQRLDAILDFIGKGDIENVGSEFLNHPMPVIELEGEMPDDFYKYFPIRSKVTKNKTNGGW